MTIAKLRVVRKQPSGACKRCGDIEELNWIQSHTEHHFETRVLSKYAPKHTQFPTNTFDNARRILRMSIHWYRATSSLVGGFNHLDKYESQWEGLSHILWTIKFMFETTIQLLPSATSLPSAPARNGYSLWLAERRRTTPRVAATAARALRSLPKIDLGGFAHQNPWIVF